MVLEGDRLWPNVSNRVMTARWSRRQTLKRHSRLRQAVVGRGSLAAGASSSASLMMVQSVLGKESLLACAFVCLCLREGRWDGGDGERTPLHTHTHRSICNF